MGRRIKVFDGATVDAATVTTIVDCLHHDITLIYVKCNHASKSIKYRVDAYADKRDTTDSAHNLLAWTVLAFGDTAIHKTTDPWDQVYLQVKNDSAGNDSSAVVWINGGGYQRG